jgi:hypothetical protein
LQPKVVVVVVAVVAAGQVVLQVALQVMVKDLHRRTFFVVPTWRTGQEAFKVFMEKKVPECSVYT